MAQPKVSKMFKRTAHGSMDVSGNRGQGEKFSTFPLACAPLHLCVISYWKKITYFTFVVHLINIMYIKSPIWILEKQDMVSIQI